MKNHLDNRKIKRFAQLENSSKKAKPRTLKVKYITSRQATKRRKDREEKKNPLHFASFSLFPSPYLQKSTQRKKRKPKSHQLSFQLGFE